MARSTLTDMRALFEETGWDALSPEEALSCPLGMRSRRSVRALFDAATQCTLSTPTCDSSVLVREDTP